MKTHTCSRSLCSSMSHTSTREANMETNDIRTHIEPRESVYTWGRVSRGSGMGWWRVMGEVGGCWQCSPGLCNPSSLPPSFLPRQRLSSPSRSHSSLGWGSFRAAGAPEGRGWGERWWWGCHKAREGQRHGHFRLASHDPCERSWLMRSWHWSSVPPVHYIRQCKVTGGRRLQNPEQINLFLFATNVAEIATGVPDRKWLSCSEIALLQCDCQFPHF